MARSPTPRMSSPTSRTSSSATSNSAWWAAPPHRTLQRQAVRPSAPRILKAWQACRPRAGAAEPRDAWPAHPVHGLVGQRATLSRARPSALRPARRRQALVRPPAKRELRVADLRGGTRRPTTERAAARRVGGATLAVRPARGHPAVGARHAAALDSQCAPIPSLECAATRGVPALATARRLVTIPAPPVRCRAADYAPETVGFAMVIDELHPPSALHLAAQRGAADEIRALLEAGADVDAKAAGGATALHHAAGLGHCDAAVALLKAGADPNAANQVIVCVCVCVCVRACGCACARARVDVRTSLRMS